MNKQVEFFFDFGSPYTYLACIASCRRFRRSYSCIYKFRLTEAFIFVLYAVQSFLFPAGDEYAWEKVYPELADDAAPIPSRKEEKKGVGLIANMDKMMAEANISPDIFNNLGRM